MIASWNLCLGLKKKKEYVLNTLRQENIDICLLQEVDIPRDYPTNILSSKDYKLEVEKSTVKSRCAVLIKNNIDYTRREDLESIDLSLCVIDVNGSENWRIINCYRLFNPPNNQSQNEHFALQLERIHDILSNPNGRKIIIAGDFNLNLRGDAVFSVKDISRDDISTNNVSQSRTLVRMMLLRMPFMSKVRENALLKIQVKTNPNLTSPKADIN